MKKYILAAVALICMTLTFVMTSCNKENDERDNVISYSASLTINGGTVSDMKSVGDYTTAIESVVGTYNTASKDAEVIAACDKVFQKHKDNKTTLKGAVNIKKFVGLSDKTGSILKTYTYE